MSTRDELTRQAEKSLRQGRVDEAIAHYEALASLAPVDWGLVRQLADLLERAGQLEAAARQFARWADHLFTEGFYSKAAALYKKVLKLEGNDEHALWRLGEVSLELKLRADARVAFQRVADLRQRRGDTAGAAAARERLAALDAVPAVPTAVPVRPPAYLSADRASSLPAVATPLESAPEPVFDADPDDVSGRLRLVQTAAEQGHLEHAARLAVSLDASDDAALVMLVELAHRRGQPDDVARLMAGRVHAAALPEHVLTLVDRLAERHPAAARAALTSAVEAWSAAGQPGQATTALDAADGRGLLTIPLYLQWVEICVDAGLPGLARAQRGLARAYLDEQRFAEARAVAEDVLVREGGTEPSRSLLLDILDRAGVADPHRVLMDLLTPPSDSLGEEDASGALFLDDLSFTRHDADSISTPEQQTSVEIAHSPFGDRFVAGLDARLVPPVRATRPGVARHDTAAPAALPVGPLPVVWNAPPQPTDAPGDEWAPSDPWAPAPMIVPPLWLPAESSAIAALPPATLERDAPAVFDWSDLLGREVDADGVVQQGSETISAIAVSPAPAPVSIPPRSFELQDAAPVQPSFSMPRTWLSDAPDTTPSDMSPGRAPEDALSFADDAPPPRWAPPAGPTSAPAVVAGPLLAVTPEDAPTSEAAAEAIATSLLPRAITTAPTVGERVPTVEEEIDLTQLLEELKQWDPVLPELCARAASAAQPDMRAPAVVEEPAQEALVEPSRIDADGTAELDAVFADIERRTGDRAVAEQQLAAGRVFLAAGLASEAARAFRRAATEPRVSFDATVGLAELHKSRGQLLDAVSWYEQAAAAPVPDAAVKRPVLYDLAVSLEALGETDRALGVLLDLLSQVEDYRDARVRLDRLLRVDAGG